MANLEMVFVASRLDAYDQEVYDIKTKDGAFMCRENLSNRQQAYKIAESIDAAMVYERDNGAGSLDFV